MVVRPVVAPSAIQEHLDAIMDKEAKFVAGLVVGQKAQAKDYILHLAVTPTGEER